MRREKGTYMKRWAVTLQLGRSRSSCARLSVRLFTAALEALYAAFPLSEERTSDESTQGRKKEVKMTYGGLVIPCLEPVFMITDGFS